MLVAGLLSIVVALSEGADLWKHEKMIFEVVVSFVVGLVTGLITISWNKATCFQVCTLIFFQCSISDVDIVKV